MQNNENLWLHAGGEKCIILSSLVLTLYKRLTDGHTARFGITVSLCVLTATVSVINVDIYILRRFLEVTIADRF